MRKYIALLALALFINITPALADSTKDDIVVQVNGMVCDFCAQSLKKVFGKEDSVNNIAVDLDKQTVTIDLKDNNALTDEKIKELIEWGGYDLVDITRAP